MSKYKVEFWCDSNANAFSLNTETVDLVDDYGFTEEEAQNIINNEDLLNELLEEWLCNYLETGVRVCLES